jgi:hypothetical protein
MDRLIPSFPETEEVGPQDGESAERPVGSCVDDGLNVLLLDEYVLADSPLLCKMSIKDMAPTNRVLFFDELAVPARVSSPIQSRLIKPGMKAVN